MFLMLQMSCCEVRSSQILTSLAFICRLCMQFATEAAITILRIDDLITLEAEQPEE